MNTESSRENLLLSKLYSAFGSLDAPSREELVRSESGEGDEIRTRFAGKRWENLSSQDLLAEPDALFFLSPIGFRFLLPAYLKASLENREVSETFLDPMLSLLLIPQSRERRLAHWEKLKKNAEYCANTTITLIIEELARVEETIDDDNSSTLERIRLLDPRQRRVVVDILSRLCEQIDDPYRLRDLARITATLDRFR